MRDAHKKCANGENEEGCEKCACDICAMTCTAYSENENNESDVDCYSISFDSVQKQYIAMPNSKELAVFANPKYSKVIEDLDVYIRRLMAENANRKAIVVKKDF